VIKFRTALQDLTGADPAEFVPVAWSFLYFFCLLCGYYILRPVRDEMAIEGGVQHLPWMMTATFLTLLIVTPIFGYLSAHSLRRRLLVSVYGFFAANLVAFFLVMANQVAPHWVARIFFVWLSVFNLFVVSVFWSFMADLFTPAQGARLFAVIAAGGSTGAMVGPLLTGGLTYLVPIPSLMLVSAGFLGGCMLCIRRLDRWSRLQPPSPGMSTEEPIGGGMWAGIRLTLTSPYLLGVCLYLFFLTTTATFLYLEQTKLVSEHIQSAASRTRFFATVDLAVNVIAFLTQIFITGQMVSRFGLGSALVALPFASAVGFVVVGSFPLLVCFALFTIVRRVGEYAVAKPAREVLFTVLNREEKYKAKNFIDTAVSRGGDAATGWIVSGVKALGATVGQIAWVLALLACVWAWLGWSLAKQEKHKQADAPSES
jgi:AAA family ATP:ADP antiporter